MLPFRVLRPDPKTDFLAFSLPDAITSSLAAIDSLVVRSMMVASRFGATPDLDVKAIAEQVQVDAIVTGTILSDRGHLRVNAQLIDASDGAVRWSKISEVQLRDVFQVQDELVDRIVLSLAVPLSPREQRALKKDSVEIKFSLLRKLDKTQYEAVEKAAERYGNFLNLHVTL